MRLIDADTRECWACTHHATGKCDTWCDYGESFCLRDDVKNAPAIHADVEPVRHGRWEDKPTGAYGRWQSWCSVCGKHSGIGGIENNRHKSYCPNCGGKDGHEILIPFKMQKEIMRNDQ